MRPRPRPSPRRATRWPGGSAPRCACPPRSAARWAAPSVPQVCANPSLARARPAALESERGCSVRGSRLPSKHGCWLWMAVCAGCVHRLRNLSLPALQQSIRSAAAAAATLPRRPASAAARRVWKAGLLRAEQRQGRAGTMGLVADLTAGEVLEQLVFALRVAPVRNVVFMVPPPARRPPGARPASGDRRCRQQGRRVAAQLSGPWCTCSEADTVGSTACPPATSRPGRSRSPAYARAGHGRAAEQLGAREGCGARDGRPQPLRPQAQQGAPPRAPAARLPCGSARPKTAPTAARAPQAANCPAAQAAPNLRCPCICTR